jgi:FlaA1/EpsC-like NDP-sugar epimerase
MSDLASGHISASTVRDVDIEDLLGRGPARLDRTEVRRFVKGKKVMITGAGGSIGSELTRQVAGYEPAELVLFEASEFALYTIEQEMRALFPNLALHACAGDIRHPEEVHAAIDIAGGVDVVFHAAAYKHVPLMEVNVPACFRTNVLGTARLARAVVERGVDRFVMISSDKAVRPTSVMGATKRLAEKVICDIPAGGTTFVSVRFGNVLGSSGSVIPLFKRQIAAGGPVTVTSPEMRRFFMTIPEAVDLVLMAGTVGRNGEVMVLEMGESVRIVDLARRLIELSGLVPDRDIRIEFTGVRPGEKEYEEVMTDGEDVVRTAYEKIWVMKASSRATTVPPVDLGRIESLVTANDTAALLDLVPQLIPESRLAALRTPTSHSAAG